MNKFLTKIATFSVGLLMAIGVGVAVGSNRNFAPVRAAADTTVTFSELGLNSGTQYTTLNHSSHSSYIEDGLSFAFGNGSNDGKYYSKGSAIRVYGGGHMTVAHSYKTFSEITLSFGTGDGSNAITTDVTEFTSPTWTGNANSVTFNVGGSSGHRRIASVAITYVAAASITVSFNMHGHGTAPDDQSVVAGQKVVKPDDPSASGWVFGGWYKEDTYVNLWDFDNDTVSEATTLHAKWTEAKTPASLALSGTYTTQFAKNASFEHNGAVVTVTYTDSTSAIVTGSAIFSNPDMTTSGQKIITVSYTENDTLVSTTYNITVLPEVNSISLNKESTTINLGKTETLIATVSADEGADTTVTWTTSDDTVATVDGGVVTASSSKVGTATITATAGSKSATCDVTVNDPNAVTDILTASSISNPSSYSAWSNKKSTSNAVYAGYSTGGNNYIQIRTSDNSSGVVTTVSGGTIKSISVTFTNNTQSGRIVEVYAKNSAYTQASDLFSDQSTTTGENVAHLTCNGSNNTVSYTFESDYTFFGIRSSSNALYLSNITVLWGVKAADEPEISITSGTDGVMSGKLGDIDSVEYSVDYKEKTPGDYTIDWAVTDNDSIIDFDNGDFEFVGLGVDATITVQLKKSGSIVDSDSVKASVLVPTVAIKALSGESVVSNSLLVEKDDEGQLGFDVTNEPDNHVTYEWLSSDDGTYFTFDDSDGTYIANANTPENTPVELTLTMKYNGTAVASNTIEITVDTLTGLIPNGNYYIMNHFMSFGMTADVTGTSNPPTGASIETSNNTIHAFSFRLVEDNTYEITTIINATTYYLINRNQSSSGSNNSVRLVNASDANGYVRTWVLTDKGTDDSTPLGTYDDNGTTRTLYNLKENTASTTWRYLTAYYSSGVDFRGYVSPYNNASQDLSTQDSRLNLIPEGTYANMIANAIMSNEQGKTLCDGGSTAPSTTLWNDIADITKIENELAILRGTDAAAKDEHGETPDGTLAEKAMARYDEIMVRYNTVSVKTYVDFLGRIEAQHLDLRGASNNVFGNSLSSSDSSFTTIIIVISLVSVTAIGGYFFMRKRKEIK